MEPHKDPVFVRIGLDNGKVVVLFSTDVHGRVPANMSIWEVDPRECLRSSEELATLAFEADSGLKPVGPALKATLIENHRMKLTQRFSVILNSLRHDKVKSNGQIAQNLVDVALKEIF